MWLRKQKNPFRNAGAMKQVSVRQLQGVLVLGMMLVVKMAVVMWQSPALVRCVNYGSFEIS
jgi:hypothetical protein